MHKILKLGQIAPIPFPGIMLNCLEFSLFEKHYRFVGYNKDVLCWEKLMFNLVEVNVS